MNNEIWKDVVGYEGHYKVSNLGRVKSCERVVKRNGSDMKLKGSLIKSRQNSTGYLRVSLSLASKRKRHFVHRLVAESFLLNDNERCYVNHKDLDKKNNNVSNLEWCTRSENMQHAKYNGRLHKFKPLNGESNPSSKLTKLDVKEIRALWGWGWFFRKEIADAYGVSQKTISDINLGYTWKHV